MNLTTNHVGYKFYRYLQNQRIFSLLSVETYHAVPNNICDYSKHLLVYFFFQIPLILLGAIIVLFALVAPFDVGYNLFVHSGFLMFEVSVFWAMAEAIILIFVVIAWIIELCGWIKRKITGKEGEPSLVAAFVSSKVHKICIPLNWVEPEEKGKK